MKQTIFFIFSLVLSATLSAQYAYEIIPFEAANSSQKGFIFTGVEVGTAAGYMTTSQEKSLRTQYGIKSEQIVSLLGSDDLYHLIIADSDRNTTTAISKAKTVNPAAKRVDIFKPGSKPTLAEATAPVSAAPVATATEAPVAKTVANKTVAKGVSSSMYKIQVAALKSPMSDAASAAFAQKTGISGLESSYDEKTGMYKYYLPEAFQDYNSAKSAISGLNKGLKTYKPFVTKN